MTDALWNQSSNQQRDLISKERSDEPRTPWKTDLLIEIRAVDLITIASFMAYRPHTADQQDALERVGEKLGWQGGANYQSLLANCWKQKPCEGVGCQMTAIPADGPDLCSKCIRTSPIPLAKAEYRQCLTCSFEYLGTDEMCRACRRADEEEMRRMG